ncbi:MAG: monofunctional biosynthetic peptidoglycan transglycosylase [Bacteroidota bacterium]
MIKKLLKKVWGALKIITSIFILYNMFVLFIVLFFRLIDPASTAFFYSNIADTVTTLFSTDDIKYKPVSIDNVSRFVPLAVIASEDQLFFEHFGFDFEQIEKAMKENTYRKRKRGASTLTMQVAKNLFLWPGKDFVRKGIEAYYTLVLELLWSKKRIIEVYLNVAEMGKGVYGVNQASKIFYKKSPSKLNMAQSATLAAILPNPKKRNPARPSAYVVGRRQRIMSQMNSIGGITYIKQNLD